MQRDNACLFTSSVNEVALRGLPLPQANEASAPGRSSMAPALTYILQETQRELGLTESEDDKALLPTSAELELLVTKVAHRLGFELNTFERDEVLAQIEKEQKPFGVLQDLVDNPAISDIIVTDYGKVTVQQGRKNLSTDIRFPSQEMYEAFIERLLAKAGTTCSTKKPIADGMVGTFARIHVVHKCLCESGPYLTIRLNRFARVDVKDLITCGLAPVGLLAYLSSIIYHGFTVLVVGEVGTGKTTLTRALAATIPAHESILVIEDTPEIRLEHPHVRYLTTREANVDGAGRVSPAECIRGGMRMAMNRIIFGEMRDAEAAEAFIDVCSSGHPGLSTIHARSATEAITRLELFLGRAQRSVQRSVLSEQIVTAVQVIVFVDICSVTGKRRIMEVKEIGPIADGVVRQRDLFRYQVQGDLPSWRVLTKVSAHREFLENGPNAVLLTEYPAILSFDDGTRFHDSGRREVAQW